jgi:hypothetical protein
LGIGDTDPVIGTITSEQSISVPVTGMQLITTTGLLECKLVVTSSSAFETYTALLTSPVLGPGQFRRAIATASLAGIGYVQGAATTAGSFQCLIRRVTAQLDDESGRIELAVEVQVEATAALSSLISVGFQVTTTAVTA